MAKQFSPGRKSFASSPHIFFLGALLVSTVANAAYIGDELRADLAATESSMNGAKLDVAGLVADARATAYIEGVSTMLSSNNVVCFPPHVKVGQTDAIVLKYLRANPEVWSSSAAVAVTKALRQSFPCP